MADLILLLPDNIANQIAAGEVIQRPASAVKELLENAVDAGATDIQLIVAEGGKALVQVIDNGSGMSVTDARMAFERHATSKIRKIDDLFTIRTMGFRGEALASIAAVAQVELRTRRADDEIGHSILLEHSKVTSQSPTVAPLGTSLSMKNLFFNVPARRNFLKSNGVEMRHIVDEFIRVALAFPTVRFSLTSNGQPVFALDSGSLKQRLVALWGSTYNARLVSVKQETDYLNLFGFVGKPETAKKTRGEQYFFVNNRFIRSPYLHHAVMNAFQDTIPADSFPAYALFIDLDPQQVDVNVHPTKQEIKFEDEKIVYAFVQSAVKHALAQFSITPTLDFDLDQNIQGLSSVQKPATPATAMQTQGSSIYQGFTESGQAHRLERSQSGTPLEKGFPRFDPSLSPSATEPTQTLAPAARLPLPSASGERRDKLVQVFDTYVLYPGPSRFFLIHQTAAHERILYERLAAALAGQPVATQRSLFPGTLEVSPADAALLEELLPDLQRLGYLIEPRGGNSFAIMGTPADLAAGNETAVIEHLLEACKHDVPALSLNKREVVLRSLSSQGAVRRYTVLGDSEMEALVAGLFACAQPSSTPWGKPTYMEYRKDELEKLFGR